MREEKILMLDEIRERVEDSTYFILTDYTGLNVQSDQELRGRLRGISASYQVVKNNLLRKTVQDSGPREVGENLQGPTSMISGSGEVTEALKVLKEFVKENNSPVVKVGALNGVFLSASELETLAALPSRDELLAKMVGSLSSPLSGLVCVMNQMVGSLVNVLKALENKKNEAD